MIQATQGCPVILFFNVLKNLRFLFQILSLGGNHKSWCPSLNFLLVATRCGVRLPPLEKSLFKKTNVCTDLHWALKHRKMHFVTWGGRGGREGRASKDLKFSKSPNAFNWVFKGAGICLTFYIIYILFRGYSFFDPQKGGTKIKLASRDCIWPNFLITESYTTLKTGMFATKPTELPEQKKVLLITQWENFFPYFCQW